MVRIESAIRWLFAVFLILHGLAHLPAVLNSWKVTSYEDISFQPNVWLTDASDRTIAVLGAVWLLAALAFVVAGIFTIARRASWLPVTFVALACSIPMCLLWRTDAVAGLVLNGALVVALIAVELWRVSHAGGEDFQRVGTPAHP